MSAYGILTNPQDDQSPIGGHHPNGVIHPRKTNTRFKRPPVRTKFGVGKLKVRRHLTAEADLPTDFVYSASVITPSRDQGQCGSCWAFAITGVVADRIKIQQNVEVPLSVQDILNCVFPSTPVCGGQDIGEVLSNLPSDGFIPEVMQPYNQGSGTSIRFPCQPEDDSKIYNVHVKPGTAYLIQGTSQADMIRNMKAHIYHDGPIIGAMLQVYPDFSFYDGVSIYEPSPSQQSDGGHAIEIIGWGKTQNGTQYWICRNSWGDQWPLGHLPGAGHDWFYVLMGNNTCGIETIAYTVIPDSSNVSDVQQNTGNDTYSGDSSDTFTYAPTSPPEVYDYPKDKNNTATMLVILAVLLIGIYLLSRKRRK